MTSAERASGEAAESLREGERDCLIVGGGPAGLTAGVYLARFRRDVLVIDAGEPRAALIPTSRNCPGFPDGIRGRDLLRAMRAHAQRFGVPVFDGTVTRVAIDETSRETRFLAAWRPQDGGAERRAAARTVLLATGVVDIEPRLVRLERAIREGYVRHCPICDGYEVIGRRIGVIGFGSGGVEEALFVRTYSADVTLLTLGEPMGLDDDSRRRLEAAGVGIVEEPIVEIEIDEGKISCLQTASGEHRFDTLYSALGAKVRSELALSLGAAHDETGALIVDDRQRTSVEGLWAAGDVSSSLNQISVAVGQAAIAATAIHRSLPRNDY